jgi:hypothetical protein
MGIFHQQNLFGCVCPGGICGDEDLGSALLSDKPFLHVNHQKQMGWSHNWRV